MITGNVPDARVDLNLAGNIPGVQGAVDGWGALYDVAGEKEA